MQSSSGKQNEDLKFYSMYQNYGYSNENKKNVIYLKRSVARGYGIGKRRN